MAVKRGMGFGLILGFVTTSAFATVTFQFNYTDVGVGFNDPVQGAARQAALQQAGNVVGGLFANYNATILLDVDGSVADGSTLAAAGSSYNSTPSGPGFGNQGAVMIKILNGDAADPAPGAADGSVTWNFTDFSWELGSDFQAGEFDFESTAIHELLHSVGFLSDIAQNGDDPFGNTPGTPGIWSPFDEFVADSSGALISPSLTLNGTRWNAASVGGAGTAGLSFIGSNAMAANGGNPVFLYTPSTWEDGSSGSHLDDQFYSGTYMMEAATDPGPGVRTVSGVELGILRDIGYLQIIPEPATATLLLAGSMMLICTARRRLP